jgi:hypothetical protein
MRSNGKTWRQQSRLYKQFNNHAPDDRWMGIAFQSVEYTLHDDVAHDMAYVMENRIQNARFNQEWDNFITTGNFR